MELLQNTPYIVKFGFLKNNLVQKKVMELNWSSVKVHLNFNYGGLVDLRLPSSAKPVTIDEIWSKAEPWIEWTV